MEDFKRIKDFISNLNSKYKLTFKSDISRQKKILNKFPEPVDNYERSYFQFICQMKKYPIYIIIPLNIAALILLLFYYIKLNRYMIINTSNINNCALFFSSTSINIIPEAVKSEYSEIISCSFNKDMFIGEKEKKVLFEIIRRYWYAPYFIIKCLLKIGMYAAKIEKFMPIAIITCNEYSFTSSILTEYCHLRGVEHINVMHGEKLFNIRDSFVKYDRFYVWDKYYKELFIALRADKKQFRIEVPVALKIDLSINNSPCFYYTYYLGGQKKEELINIKNTFLKTGVPTSNICIRYHPRRSKKDEIRQIFKDFAIENPNEVTLSISLSNTKYVVSLYSTVLYQAYKNDKVIIIDDISNKRKYEKLKDLHYIMLKKPHVKLSDHLVES